MHYVSTSIKTAFALSGHYVLNEVYSVTEVSAIINSIENAQKDAVNFRKSADVFAIRQFLKEIPEVASFIFNEKLNTLISKNFGDDYFVVKSIYFDKPPQSNWFVAWHQDLTISVDQKTALENFGSWTVKHNQYAVQPPVQILENIFTIRIHLDDTDENNGALKIIPGSHDKGVQRVDEKRYTEKDGIYCPVPKGGIMLMKPLLFHSSSRTTNTQQRRVIHIEFSNCELPQPLQWAEKLTLSY